MKIINPPKFIHVGFTNCYLLDGDDGYLLIDIGYPNNLSKFIQKLKKQHNIEISEISHLLLTHHHDDHAGFAFEFLESSDLDFFLNFISLSFRQFRSQRRTLFFGVKDHLITS